MSKTVYELLRQAVKEKQQVLADYEDFPREFCPHVLGTRDGEQRCFAYQFAGDSHEGNDFPDGSAKNWRCFRVHELKNVRLRKGDWHTAHPHKQTCVTEEDVSVWHPEKP